MNLHQNEIKQIEKFMEEESFATIDNLVDSYRRLKNFALKINDSLDNLNRYGDLD